MTDAPRVVVLVGLPGSGKSTWAEKKAGVLSSDEMRRLLADDATDQSIHTIVFRTLRELLRTRLELGRPVTYIDATNLTPEERRPYIELAQSFGASVEAVFFDVPIEECQRRNASRGRVVPAEAIVEMAARLLPPTEAEGFARVVVIRS